ncbi:MAG: hypothetical protein ACOY4Q_03145 [Bacillota bacterium]
MLQKFFHFTITCDARRQIPKMILERLVEEYIWQANEGKKGPASIKERATRIQQLIRAEVDRRKAQAEFDKILNQKYEGLEAAN